MAISATERGYITLTSAFKFVCVFECVITWPVSFTHHALVSSFCHLPLPPY